MNKQINVKKIARTNIAYGKINKLLFSSKLDFVVKILIFPPLTINEIIE